MRVDVQCYFRVFVTSKNLNRFDIHACEQQVRDIRVPKLVRRYLKVHAIYNTCIVRCFLAQNRRDGVLDFLPIHIPGVGALLGAADGDILPEPSPLCARQRLPLTACNDIIRNRRFFDFFQTINELRRNA